MHTYMSIYTVASSGSLYIIKLDQLIEGSVCMYLPYSISILWGVIPTQLQ